MTPRRLALVLVALAVVAVAAVALVLGRSDAPAPTPAPSPTAEGPRVVAPEDGEPGDLVFEGFLVAEGTRLVEEPVTRESAAVSGWSANLDLTGDAAAVAAEYRSQLQSQGYTLVRDEVVAEGPAAGALSLEGQRTGMLPGAAQPAPVDVVRIDVIPADGAVPGYVRFVVTHLKG